LVCQDEVYIATGVGGGLLVIALLLGSLMLGRYR
jgi:hypothetical protein